MVSRQKMLDRRKAAGLSAQARLTFARAVCLCRSLLCAVQDAAVELRQQAVRHQHDLAGLSSASTQTASSLFLYALFVITVIAALFAFRISLLGLVAAVALLITESLGHYHEFPVFFFSPRHLHAAEHKDFVLHLTARHILATWYGVF